MTLKFAKDIYQVKNLEKYVGNKLPVYRSSWELTFMMFCDNNPAIQEWSSECVKIPYRDPLTGKQTVYVPDFLITYVDKNMKKHGELIEIKPAKQSIRERVGKNPYDQAQYVKNMAKWEAAGQWARNHGLKFRVINENDIFQQGSKRR
ncbi:MAG: head completion protein [Synechococcaceae bacterium WB8_1B_057]|nr:head completion protein [Synechococcaceae bacterium WB6_1A_059]NDG79360.1 head completion protein [Synechococcaceae bacterium WB8_1B_057]